ncbi:MAG: outer membrane beta-barrel protein [Alistipes sp.]|nr:outer membrane beta-barrel protein [Alistipes sp.]
MKKITLLLVALICAMGAEAQMVSTSTLIVTKEKFPAVEPGYESMVQVTPTIGSAFQNVNINYIGGYRFNHVLFLGVGTGLDFNTWHDYGETSFKPDKLLYIPLYAKARAYILDKRWSPFVDLTAGGRFSTKEEYDGFKYSTNGFMLDVGFGVNYRITPKISAYFVVGYEFWKYPYLEVYFYPTDYNGTPLDSYIGVAGNTPGIAYYTKKTVEHQVTITLGLTF